MNEEQNNLSKINKKKDGISNNSVPTLSKLPNPIELLKKSFWIWARHLTVYIGIYLLAIIAVILISLPLFFLFFGFFLEGFKGAQGVVAFLPLFVVVITAVGFYWAYVAILYKTVTDQNAGILDAFKKSTGKIIPLFWVSTLSGFISIGGYVLFIIPGIVVAVWFVFVPYIFMNENLPGMKALVKSREYVRGYWWSIFGRLLLLLVVFYVPQIIFFIAEKLSIINDPNTSDILFGMLNTVVPLLLTSFAVVYLFELYKSVRNAKPLEEVKSTGRQKTLYAVLGTLGVLIPLIGILLAVLLASLNTAHDMSETQRENPNTIPSLALRQAL